VKERGKQGRTRTVPNRGVKGHNYAKPAPVKVYVKIRSRANNPGSGPGLTTPGTAKGARVVLSYYHEKKSQPEQIHIKSNHHNWCAASHSLRPTITLFLPSTNPPAATRCYRVLTHFSQAQRSGTRQAIASPHCSSTSIHGHRIDDIAYRGDGH